MHFWVIVAGSFDPIYLITWKTLKLREKFSIGHKTYIPFFLRLVPNKCRSDKYVGTKVRVVGRNSCTSSYTVRYFVRFQLKLETVEKFYDSSHRHLHQHIANTHSGKGYKKFSNEAVLNTSYEAQASTI